MSKFKIYHSDLKDPGIISRYNKRLIISLAVFYLLILLVSNFSRSIISNNILETINYVLIGSGIITLIGFIIFNKTQSGRIKKIGYLEFRRSTIIKTIGDLRMEYPLENVQRIELENHISSLKLADQKNAFITFIIKIVNKDSSHDKFVIASKSDDFKQKIVLTDTLNLLKRLSDIEVTINTNNKKTQNNLTFQ